MFSWSLLIKTWWLQWVSIKVDQCFLFEITMLRKRSRTTVPSKQALMAKNGSPKDKNLKPTTSLFSSPRLFSVLSSSSSSSSSKVLSESDCVKSPTSILDNKPFSGFGNPFWSDNRNLAIHEAFPLENRHPWEKNFDSGVGLGIVDALNDEEHNQKFSNNPNSRMVLFGSQLKIQIPPIPSLLLSSFESPKSPNDFGIKTYAARKSPFGSSNSGLETPNSPKIFTGCLSATEMECSEDYTCVITHGPNPRTTHIFDDCIVENCCGVVGFSASKEEEICSDQSEYPSESFLSFCCTCKKNLEQGKDIYMYRGEKAFCSHECRNQEILIDEGKEKSGLDIDST